MKGFQQLVASRYVQEEFEKEFNGPDIFVKPFFGERFNPENVRSYKPDTAINNQMDMNIGGSKFELSPVRGGETHDAMLIYLPDERVMFMGDVIIPYLGPPFDEDGDLPGLFDAIALTAWGANFSMRIPHRLMRGFSWQTLNQ